MATVSLIGRKKTENASETNSSVVSLWTFKSST